MKNSSSQFDAYMARSAPFAQPILKKLRTLFHRACPQIEETIKWGHPHFEYKGVVAGVAAFKAHVSFGFWKEKLLSDPHGLFAGESSKWARLTDVAELPSDEVLLAYIREAVELNERGVKRPQPKKPRKAPPEVPADLRAALAKNPKARATFEAFSPSHQREYIEWLTEAKTEATRQKRLGTAIEWMAEGKPRNWKYMKKK